MLHTGIKNMNSKFLHDMLVKWFYGGIIVLMMDYYSGTWEPV